MSDPVRNMTGCRVCGKEDWLDVLSFGPMALANNYLDPAPSYDAEPKFPMDVIVCRNCWLMAIRQVVDPDVLYRHYVYISSDSRLIVNHMRQLAQLAVSKFQVPPGSLVVEMGSNIGTQLEAFRDLGMRILGVDPARNLADLANAKGVETLPEFFRESIAGTILARYGSPRLILGRHVFAHIDDLTDVIEAAARLMGTDGILAVEVPYLLDLIQGNQFDTVYHEHLSYFSVGTLRRLFERHGLRVVDVARFSVHGGAIVVFVGRADGRWTPSPAVSELEELEARSGLTGERVYLDFAARTQRTIHEIGALLRTLAGEGKRVAGYGAPAKGNTLLNACRVGTRELQYVSDTTEFKQGKVLPGTHVPVVSPDHARRHLPDYFLLLPWNYANEIVTRERTLIEQGVRFIVPIPDPLVITNDTLTDTSFTLSHG
jgi:novobiocin biosynthesis protein NovU/D-mycarose 3-C-methyltransferase